MPLDPKYTQPGHPDFGGGRPRTSVPEKEELIELGKDLVKWATEQKEKKEPIRVRFCDWYTDRGFIRTQWEHMRVKPEFYWYYERARAALSTRYLDGTVNASIAHRYLRIYDIDVREQEDEDKRNEIAMKLQAAKDVGVEQQTAIELLAEKLGYKQTSSNS